jgi:hypothetical protein
MALKRYGQVHQDWDDPISKKKAKGVSYRAPRGSGGTKVASLRMVAANNLMHLECGYNGAFIDTLKKSIPTKKRYYDAGDQTWYIVSDQLDKLCIILDQYFDETILLDFPALVGAEDDWAAMYLLKDAPVEVVRAAYRALAQLYHPDKGGDAEKMTKLNTAYKNLMGEFTNGQTD